MRGINPELVIFDCDGVLIDSEAISASTLIAMLRPLGMIIDTAYVQRNFLGRSFPTVAARLREEFKLNLPPDFEANYRKKLLDNFETRLKPTFGVEAILQQIDCRFCVATSSSPERASRSLRIAGLRAYFDGHIYTASEVSRGKPAPDLFLHVARQENVSPAECLVIEDSQPGIEAARAAGMHVLRYIGGGHFAGDPKMARGEDVLTFDSWSVFFDIMPMLKVSETANGEQG